MTLALERTGIAFARDRRAVALMEFTLFLPLVVALGMGGMELTNLTLAHQKVERLAGTSADLFARNQVKPNERQVNDSFTAIDIMSKPFDLRKQGRVIVTGIVGTADSRTGKIENKIAWQRCDGDLTGQVSSIGKGWTKTNDFSDGPAVVLPDNILLSTGQMVVTSEVFFQYKPIISGSWLPGNATAGPFKELAVNRTRGAAFTSITPVNGVVARTC